MTASSPSSRAVALRRREYSDTTYIVTWLTQDFGKVTTIAKGARRPKSPFAGVLDLFRELEISWSPSRSSDLHTLREVSLVGVHAGPKSHRDFLLRAYFCDLVDRVTEPDHPTPDLYQLIVNAMRYLDEHEPSRKVLDHFENRLAEVLGVAGGSLAQVSDLSGRELETRRIFLREEAGQAIKRTRHG